jgi:hypothetical protein
MPWLCGVMADVWHGGSHAVVVWHVGGRAEVVVGVRQQSRRVVVAAWHGGGGQSHGLVVVVVVVSQQLWHGGRSYDLVVVVVGTQRRQLCHATVQLRGGRRCGPSSYEAHGDVACAAAREAATWPIQL